MEDSRRTNAFNFKFSAHIHDLAVLSVSICFLAILQVTRIFLQFFFHYYMRMSGFCNIDCSVDLAIRIIAPARCRLAATCNYVYKAEKSYKVNGKRG